MATTGVRLTWDEFLARCPESGLAEWVGGGVVEHVPPAERHQDVVGFLFHLLRSFAGSLGLGQVLPAPFAMRLSPDGPAREPDVLFVATEHNGRFRRTHLEGPADLVVEVASEDSVVRDRIEKFDEYERGGVREYWVIDVRPGRERADFWVLDAHGRYRPVPPAEDGVYHSAVLPGFWLRVEWLVAAPGPDALLAFAEVADLPQSVADAIRGLRARGSRHFGAPSQ